MSLRGRLVSLRAATPTDLLAIKPAYDNLRDVAREDDRPYGPDWNSRMIDSLEKDSKAPFTASSTVSFAIVRQAEANEQFLGLLNVWGVDAHQRCANIGVTLLPTARGKGYGTDATRLAVEFGLVVRGLHRMALITMTDNLAMQRCADKSLMTREATMRQAMWWNGKYRDVYGYAILDVDWPGYDRVAA